MLWMPIYKRGEKFETHLSIQLDEHYLGIGTQLITLADNRATNKTTNVYEAYDDLGESTGTLDSIHTVT
jgi:hypothetical protein